MGEGLRGEILPGNFRRFVVPKPLRKQGGQPPRPAGDLVYPPVPEPLSGATSRKSHSIFVDISRVPQIAEELDEFLHRSRFKTQKEAIIWLIHFAHVNEITREKKEE